MEHSISIIICCYNSAKRIGETLKYISNQKVLPYTNIEVIIVDNNSNDNSAQIAYETWLSLGNKFPIKNISESEQGLIHARKKGIENASYKYILFCDDDNWLAEDYVITALKIMEQNPEIGILVGQGIAYSSIKIPNWFYSVQKSYACGVLRLDTGDVSDNGWVWGAGMVFNKSLYNSMISCGFNHLCIGRQGNILLSGDDVELSLWFTLLGYKLWYSEDLLYHHFIEPFRLDKAYYKSMNVGYKLSRDCLNPYYIVLRAQKKIKKSNINILVSMLKFLLLRSNEIDKLIIYPFSFMVINDNVINIKKSINKYNRINK